jgi:hypothetical protein
MLIDSVVWIILLLAFEGFFDGNHISLQLCKIDLNLAYWHFGSELIHIDLFLFENWVLILLPNLLYYVQPCIHFVVLRFYLLQPFQSVQLEAPGATLYPSTIQVVAYSERDFQYVMEAVV